MLERPKWELFLFHHDDIVSEKNDTKFPKSGKRVLVLRPRMSRFRVLFPATFYLVQVTPIRESRPDLTSPPPRQQRRKINVEFLRYRPSMSWILTAFCSLIKVIIKDSVSPPPCKEEPPHSTQEQSGHHSPKVWSACIELLEHQNSRPQSLRFPSPLSTNVTPMQCKMCETTCLAWTHRPIVTSPLPNINTVKCILIIRAFQIPESILSHPSRVLS